MAEQSVSFQFDVLPTVGPDGKQWVRFLFESGPLAQVVTVPEQVAQQILALVASKGTAVCAAARRANMGLLTADQNTLPKFPPVNGSKT